MYVEGRLTFCQQRKYDTRGHVGERSGEADVLATEEIRYTYTLNVGVCRREAERKCPSLFNTYVLGSHPTEQIAPG